MGVTISSVEQFAFDGPPAADLFSDSPDVAVFTSGSKRRHTYFSRLLDKNAPIVRIVYEEGQTELTSLSRSIVAAAHKDLTKPLSVFVDVSCLPRPAIAHIFAGLAMAALVRDIQLRIAYSVASYAAPPSIWAAPNRAICPVHPLFSGWTSEGASAPLDVVVGLGYERGKALGAVEYLEPRHRWIWIPKSPEEDYLEEVKRHNKDLIDDSEDHVAHYHVLSPADTYFSIRSLVEGMAMTARPVLLPFGPKLFFAINLLVAMTIEEAAVWHVSGESDEYGDRNPSKYSAVFECVLSKS